MTTLEILVKARGLIALERDWRQGWPVRGEDNPRRCAGDALVAVGGDPVDASRLLINLIEPNSGNGAAYLNSAVLWIFNDSHTHAEVLALFDRAIERQRTLESLINPPSSDTFLPSEDSLRTADAPATLESSSA
jgi:hypothetical protein